MSAPSLLIVKNYFRLANQANAKINSNLFTMLKSKKTLSFLLGMILKVDNRAVQCKLTNLKERLKNKEKDNVLHKHFFSLTYEFHLKINYHY